MGCMGFSNGYGQIPKRDYSIKAIRDAFEYGCTFYDTAEVYGDVLYHEGHNEEIVGEAVKDFRKDIVLATKFHLHNDEILSGRQSENLIALQTNMPSSGDGFDKVLLKQIYG